jgi:hypothetical protein
MHATLVTLTALKGFAAPGGVLRVKCTGTTDQAELTFRAERETAAGRVPTASGDVIPPMALAAALLSSSALQVEQELGPEFVTVTWWLPSLKAMRRMAREAAQQVVHT